MTHQKPEPIVLSGVDIVFAEVDPGGVETETSHIRTLEHVLRAWFAGYVEPRCPDNPKTTC